MRRDPQAFLNDVIEAGNAIIQAVHGISLEDYEQSRLIRSSVEREFILIGEALKQLSQHDDTLFASIEEAPQIIAFRNKLTHEYVKVSDRLVWGVIAINLPRLVERCSELLRKLDGGE
jgi:uncharacterized protein with HEPN domain